MEDWTAATQRREMHPEGKWRPRQAIQCGFSSQTPLAEEQGHPYAHRLRMAGRIRCEMHEHHHPRCLRALRHEGQSIRLIDCHDRLQGVARGVGNSCDLMLQCRDARIWILRVAEQL